MAGTEYRKKLADWMAAQRRTEIQRKEEKPYNSSRMPVRAPLGCILAALAGAAAVAYFIGKLSGFWSSFF